MTTEEKWHEVKFADGINNNIVAMDEGGRILLADKEARAEIVKLKQAVAELRATIQWLADFIGASTTITQTAEALKSLDDGWPWDADAMDSATVPKCDCEWNSNLARAVGSTVGWWCPVHGNCCGRLNLGMKSTGAQQGGA